MFFLTKPKIFSTAALIIALFLCIAVKAQFTLTGTPQIVNFTKNTYGADSRNWSVAQNNDGILFFGNGEGLLSFNGAKWTINKLPDNQTVRAVAVDNNGRIFTGGYGEFGYWEALPKGPLTYTSLNAQVEKPIFKKEEVWKILPAADGVFFQSFSQLYRYRNNKVTSIELPGNLMLIFSIRGKDYIQVLERGLYLVNKDNSATKINGSDVFNDKKIISIIPFINNSVLIGTVKHGFYIYDGFSVQKWDSEAGDFIQQNDLNAGIQIDDNRYAFGTIQNGLIISDAQGRIIHHINRQKGLQNNTVLSLYKDFAGNIVAPLDNGIDYIVINSALTFFKDNLGRIGASYTAHQHNNHLYIGSNHGLFNMKIENANPFMLSAINKVDNISEQVWSLSKIDDLLLCGNNNATYTVQDNNAQKISSVPGGWSIEKLLINPDYLIQGSYIGIALYGKDAHDSWQYLRLLDSANNIPAKKIVQDSKGNLWIKHANKGVFHTKIYKDLRSDSLKPVEIEDLPGHPTEDLYLFSLNNKVYISIAEKIYNYNYSSNKFLYDEQISKQLKTYTPFNALIQDGNKVMIIKDNHTIIMLSAALDAAQEIVSWKQANFSMVNAFENILRLNDNLYIICGEEGFLLYDNYYTNPVSYRPQLFIDNIEIWNGQTYVYDSTKINTRLSYRNNGVRMSIAHPYFDRDILYRYSISTDENDDKWTGWTRDVVKEFYNLPSGKYYIKVQSGLSGEIIQYSFVILRPWYASITAIILYVLLFLALCYFIYRYVKQRVDKQNEYIRLQHERKLLEEKRKFEHLAMLKHQEELEKEVIIKNEDIARSAMKLIKNRKALQKLKTEINKLKGEHVNDSSNFQIQKLAKQLDRLIQDDQEERNLFENGFSKVHEDFFTRLLADYPQLTSQDLKLAAYLRMNLSSKEIAPLLDISLRGVEIKRYRLRKKMDISSENNLTDIMMKF